MTSYWLKGNSSAEGTAWRVGGGDGTSAALSWSLLWSRLAIGMQDSGQQLREDFRSFLNEAVKTMLCVFCVDSRLIAKRNAEHERAGCISIYALQCGAICLDIPEKSLVICRNPHTCLCGRFALKQKRS